MKKGDVYRIKGRVAIYCLDEKNGTKRVPIDEHGYLLFYTGEEHNNMPVMKSVATGDLSIWAKRLFRGPLEKAE